MDRSTISQYGWLVCVILIIAILLGMAAPFAGSIRAAFMDATTALTDKANEAIDYIDNGMVDDDNQGGLGGTGGSEPELNYGELNQYGFYFDKPYTAKVTMNNGIQTSMSIICSENNTYTCYAGGTLYMSGSATYNNDGTVVCDMGGVPVPSTLSADGKTVTLPAGFLGSSPVDFVCDPTPKTVKYNVLYKGTIPISGNPINVAFELSKNNTAKMYIENQLDSTYALQYTPISGVGDNGLAFLMSSDGNTVTVDALIGYNAFGVTTDIVFSVDPAPIDKPSNLQLNNRVLTFDAVSGAVKYEITVGNNEPFYVTTASTDLSSKLPASLSGDVIFISVRAIGNVGDFPGGHISDYAVCTYGVPGLYDESNNLLASWDVLVNTYGLNVEKDFVDADTNVTVESDSSSMYYIKNNNAELSAGTKLVVGTSATKIGTYALVSCWFTEVSLPNTIITIGQQAFNMNYIPTMIIPDSVTTIGYGAFFLTNLSNLTIGNSVVTIGEAAFNQLNNFSGEIVIPDSVKTIGALAFEYTPMTSVILGNSVETIGRRAFFDCGSLTSVVISKSVTTIEEMAFDECDNLTDVYYTGTQSEWNALVANMGADNEYLTNATIHYNYVIE